MTFFFKTDLVLGKLDLQNEKSKCPVPQTWFVVILGKGP